MATLRIESLNRDIEIKPYTRGIARQAQEKLFEGVMISSDGEGTKTGIPAINGERSSELVIQLMTGLSREELDSILAEEYEAIREAVNKETSPEKKKR